jgi:hypothetical protein
MATTDELLYRMVKDNRWWVPGWSNYPSPPFLSRGAPDDDLIEFHTTFGFGLIRQADITTKNLEYNNVWSVLHQDLGSLLELLYDELNMRDPHNKINYVIWTMEALKCFNEGGEYGSTKPSWPIRPRRRNVKHG